MKILLWSSSFFPHIGGLEVLVGALAESLLKQGHEVAILSNGKQPVSLFLKKIPSYQLPFISALQNRDLVQIKQIFNQLGEWFEKHSFDLVHSHGWLEWLSFYQEKILQKYPLPLCLTIHGLVGQPSFATPLCQTLWHRAGGVSAVSQSIYDELLLQGFSHPRLRLIYNALPLSSTPLRPLPEGPLCVGLIGRLSSEKGFDTALKALAQIKPFFPSLKARLIGKGAEGKALLDLRKELGIEELLSVEGEIPPDAIESVIDECSLVIVPSTYESFGLLALQASLRERAVIASDVGGLKEVVLHGQTGLKIPPDDVHALAEAMMALLKNPSQMKEMGQRGRKRAETLFSLEKMTQDFCHLYQTIAHVD